MDDDELLRVGEVTKLFGIATATLYGWRCRGLGPRAIKVGGQLRYRRSEINRWLEANADPQAPTD